MNLSNDISKILRQQYGKSFENASTVQLYNAVSRAALGLVSEKMYEEGDGKRVGYMSAEFLIGRMIFSNLYNMGLLDEVRKIFEEHELDITRLEEVEDLALGNGGLGRLAAGFLDSGATCGIALDGYGIRYKYGLFKQEFKDGFQREIADDWQKYGDPWSIRCDEDAVAVEFGDQCVKAVPYDMPIIGYSGKTVNKLRLWQCEAMEPFDFQAFNAQKYDLAVSEADTAENISRVLYPNDDTEKGKMLRLKQQYFFTSASLQDIERKLINKGKALSDIAKYYVLQLNDTHPVVAIPELIRLLMKHTGTTIKDALKIAIDTFAYTNHTIMPEALEKWDVGLFKTVIPEVFPFVELLDSELRQSTNDRFRIIEDGKIHMARLAMYASHSTNGVAEIHTELLKNAVLKDWYELYPERFNNKTNGITQRRWLALANEELSALISSTISSNWITNLSELKGLEANADDEGFLRKLIEIKQKKKQQLADYIQKKEGIAVNPSFIFDVQIKRLHEYKRQLLNAFSILDIYFGLKDGSIKDFKPTLFLFGAKAAPGYKRAKGIIKFINEIAKMIAADDEVNKLLQVVFVTNYNVSYAEKIIPAADVSEQISTAGSEASGTGNMKLMLNGAVTLGTYDGANIEIVQEAGEENNYIFGARVKDLITARNDYNPAKLIQENKRIKRVVETLIDGTFNDGGTGIFKELYDSLTVGAAWHAPDQYFLILDFIDYCDTRLRMNREFSDELQMAKKSLMNIANAGKFSSDRTIKQYANEIWKVEG